MVTRREGPGRPWGQPGRRAVRVLAVVALVVVVRAWVGVWPAAVLGASAVTVGLLAGSAAVDRRLFTPRARPVVPVERGPRSVPDRASHVAFARGLAGLAGWYLAECERQEAQR